MQKAIRALLSLLILAGTIISIRLMTSPKLHQIKAPTRMVMGTFTNMIAVAESKSAAEKSLHSAFEQLRKIDEMMSDYIEESELSKVNRNAFKEPVKVSGQLFDVLTKSMEYSIISKGAFDITIGPMVDLWARAEKTNTKPTPDQIAKTKEKTGYQKLILDPDNKTVKFAVNGMRLDLGAIAKGYAIDQAVSAMKQSGAVGGMVDAGGDIRSFGKPAEKPQWRIAIQDPDSENKLLMVIKLTDTAIATSGDYRRFIVLGDQRYSHIITPEKGTSAKDFSSVSIIAKTAIDADALATTVSVIGMEKGLKLIESLPETEALLIPSEPQKEMIFTPGFQTYIEENKVPKP